MFFRFQGNLVSNFDVFDFRSNFSDNSSTFMTQDHGFFYNKVANSAIGIVVYVGTTNSTVRYDRLETPYPVALTWTLTSCGDSSLGRGRSSMTVSLIFFSTKAGFCSFLDIILWKERSDCVTEELENQCLSRPRCL